MLKIRIAVAAALAVWGSAALADVIEPGLWKITSQAMSNGVLNPPQVSGKCLTAKETQDVATTFSPVPRMVNSECDPIERRLEGTRLTWRLVCKGQLNVELVGRFEFDTPRHYRATMLTKSSMGGAPMVEAEQRLDAEWVSECQPGQ